MSNEEHYFENLIFQGEHDNDINTEYMSQEVKEAIEDCYSYLAYTFFESRENLDKFIKMLKCKEEPYIVNFLNEKIKESEEACKEQFDVKIYGKLEAYKEILKELKNNCIYM